MRKKAQERKRNSSPSPSSSSLSCVSPSPGEPPLGVGVETSSLATGVGADEGGVKGYSMDQIWNEIATPEAASGLSFEEYRDEACDISRPQIPSPMWEYCSDSLWKLDDEEFKDISRSG